MDADLHAICPRCDITAPVTAHLWPAASPRVLLTPRTAAEDPARGYLATFFDDVRLCVECGAEEERSACILELQFAARVVTHVGFGRRPRNGRRLDLFHQGGSFIDLYFDRRQGFLTLVEPGVQGMTAAGECFAPLLALAGDERHAAFEALQPALQRAMVFGLRRHRADFVPFDEERLDRQRYGTLLVSLHGERGNLYAQFSMTGPILQLLPPPPTPTPNLDDMFCEVAIELRNWL